MNPSGCKAYRPMPANFAEDAKSMSVDRIMARWDVGKTVALRWRREAGLTRLMRRPDLTAEQIQHLTDTMSQEAAAELVGVSNVTFRKMQRLAGVVIPDTRTQLRRQAVTAKRIEQVVEARPIHNARAEYARDYLQRLDAIWRCDATGAFSLTGHYYKFRGRVYDPNGIVQRALEAGWNPDAWKQIGVAA